MDAVVSRSNSTALFARTAFARSRKLVPSALIPWNSCGAYMTATLGVSTLSYAPYAVFNYAIPLLTVAFAYAGFRMFAAPAFPKPG